jgi:hypothetical protein
MNHIKLLIVLGVMYVTIAAGAHLVNVAKQYQADHNARLTEIMEQMQ